MRTVEIDPDGTQDSYLGVIVEHPTGVTYRQQCAGVECDHRSVEGYFVPLGGVRFDADDRSVDWTSLQAVFHEGTWCVFGGSSLPGPPRIRCLTADRLEQLRAVLATIPYWTYGEPGRGETRSHLRLDEERLDDIAEAWVPVVLPDGRGILTWPNCD